MTKDKSFSGLQRLAIALIGGILMGLTPAPVGAWPLAWIALTPLWVLAIRRQGIKAALLQGVAWGSGYHGLALFWITGVHPMTWMGVPWLASLAIAIFCWVAITFWGAVLVGTWAAGMAFLCRLITPQALLRGGIGRKRTFLLQVLIGTALWCGLEALWSSGPLWWSSLSYTQSPDNLVILHLGQLSGPSTVTAAIVAVNGLVAEAIAAWTEELKASRLRIKTSNPPLQGMPHEQPSTLNLSTLQPLLLAVILFVGLHLVGFTLYSRPLLQPEVAALNVGIIQGNIPNDIKLFSDGKSRALENYTAGYKALANQGVDAVLTPEVALPVYLPVLKQLEFYSAILEKGILAWVGAYGEQGRSYTNSLFTITGKGEVYSRYDKVKLVPLGEYIPFEQALGQIIDRLSPLDAHLAAGQPNQLFDTPFGRAIVSICYESAFAKHFRRQAAAGGQFILSSSNDAHYSETMPAQHHAQDVMRAIETDRWAVRATNTGYSAIVDPHGRTLWISGINTYEVHAATIYRRQTQTLYVRWGDWLTPVLLGLGVLGWVYRQRS